MCECTSCYLIDFEGNLWTFGYNSFVQLGHGDRTVPKIINTLKDIQQISYGSSGRHFFAKNLEIKYLPLGIIITDNLEHSISFHSQRNKFTIFYHLERRILQSS